MIRGSSILFRSAALFLVLPVCVISATALDNKAQSQLPPTGQGPGQSTPGQNTPSTPDPMAHVSPDLLSSNAPLAPPLDPNAPKLTPRTRLELMRSLQAERVYARILFPQGHGGLKIKDGVITPNQMAVAQQVSDNGAAARPGDRCVITNVEVKEKEIILEINGGPKKNQKWYQHIQVMGGSTSTAIPGPVSQQSLDAHGSMVTLLFDKYVPEMTGDQVRDLLEPVFDFKALTTAEAYEKTLPPKVRDAIKNHEVLVGMDKEMVTFAKGRAPRKIRDKDDQGQDYEEWIYGNPPEEVDFVRFKGNEVARLEIMTVDGQKVVRTEKEVDLKSKEAELAEQKPKEKPANAPSLRRPGEQPEYGAPDPASQRVRRPQDSQAPSDGAPYPDPSGMPVPGPGGSVPPQ